MEWYAKFSQVSANFVEFFVWLGRYKQEENLVEGLQGRKQEDKDLSLDNYGQKTRVPLFFCLPLLLRRNNFSCSNYHEIDNWKRELDSGNAFSDGKYQ